MDNQPIMAPTPATTPPKKKSPLVLGLIIGACVIVAIVAGVVVFSLTHTVDYEEAYQLARDVKSQVGQVAYETDCANVINFAKSRNPEVAKYNSYVQGCAAIEEKIAQLQTAADKLGTSSGIKNDSELRTAYGEFQESLNAAAPDIESLKEQLKLYQTWHEFVISDDKLLIAKADEATIKAVAQPLLDSDNTTLRQYGEGWLEKTLAYAKAAWAYNDSFNSTNSNATRRALEQEATSKKSERAEWIKTNEPDILELGGLDLGKLQALRSQFDKIYEVIKTKYMDSDDSILFLY